MMKMSVNFYEFLAANDYPGRGVCLGKSPSGNKALIAYFIMGRSPNSRNRVFEAIDGGIRTRAADPAKMTDPHLIIYRPVLMLGSTTIVTNGDQTDTIYDFLSRNPHPGYNFEAALTTRTFEDDRPHWTPRISGLLDMKTGAYKLHILKSDHGNEQSLQRFTFDYPQPSSGFGHFISTYQGNGNPLPSFEGEPIRVALDEDSPRRWAERLWTALNADNKVSLFVRAVDLKTEKHEDVIINKYKALEE